ncbi:hypothetical protein KY389_10770 [Paracoccus bogoriensis]|uniref:hypothetical protein n=1 Tax=Paracoccus bogoriensis TaxID=242065 RepID=UPI001CA4DD83|nr:hypothetical protein [Paracoccus bogoriensis]MBW7057169.1 hypothetical protein [Paracoccus bogoriensis]
MTDILLAAGLILCLLSVVLAVVQLLRTQPPRAAALAFVAGILLIFWAFAMQPQPFSPEGLASALDRLTQRVLP